MWKIWCARNKLVFDGVYTSAEAIVAQVRALLHEVLHEYGSETSTAAKPTRKVTWVNPSEGCVAFNVDGSAITKPGLSGFGGLIRDHNGVFILHGFYGSIGNSDILHAELMALLHGVDLCWRLGFKEVMRYSDSLHTINLIKEGNPNLHRFGNEVAEIKQMLQQDWIVQIHHTLREENQCADFLAKMGARSSEAMAVIDKPPSGMDTLLLADALGISFSFSFLPLTMLPKKKD